MKWISVDDELPPTQGASIDQRTISDYVLISDGVNVGFGYMEEEYLEPRDTCNSGGFSILWVDKTNLLSKSPDGKPLVTHWSFSPDPPNLIFSTSGVNIEKWSAQEEKGTSDLTVFLKQTTNLTMLQKSFDQYLENH